MFILFAQLSFLVDIIMVRKITKYLCRYKHKYWALYYSPNFALCIVF